MELLNEKYKDKVLGTIGCSDSFNVKALHSLLDDKRKRLVPKDYEK